jgi:hypothetical protein
MNKETAFERLNAYLGDLWIIDTHEHLPGREELLDPQGDFLHEYLWHYFCTDLVAAGLTQAQLARARDKSLPVMDRWAMLEPYWQRCRFTGYGRSLSRAVQGIYGLPDIRTDTIQELDARFKALRAEGSFEYVLKQKSRIHMSVLDSDLNCDKRYFRSMFRMDDFLSPHLLTDIQDAERRAGMRVRGFLDWLDACDKLVDEAWQAGAVGFKTTIAYERPLAVERASFHEAEACFNAFFDSAHIRTSPPVHTTRAYEDYMIHRILRRVEQRGMIAQIHTGMFDGFGNLMRNADPVPLCSLFPAFPDLRFVLMHIGYPYQMALSAIGKMFPNVYLDMCWAHILSPNASRQILSEWLDAMPYTKICAFGGDYLFIDGVYGHQAIAREDVAWSLAQKVAEGVMDEACARQIGYALLVSNPYTIFGLERLGVAPPPADG